MEVFYSLPESCLSLIFHFRKNDEIRSRRFSLFSAFLEIADFSGSIGFRSQVRSFLRSLVRFVEEG